MPAASRPARTGCSPSDSATRPQRGSSEMSIIGANVHATPSTVASPAAMAAASSASSSSQVAARPSGIGKTVRCPWMTSRPNSSGMPSRDSSTAIRWALSMLPARTPSSRTLPAVAPEAYRLEPTPPARMSGDVVGVDVADLVGLADLLLERHLGEQGLDPLLRREGGVEPGAVAARHGQSVSTTMSGPSSPTVRPATAARRSSPDRRTTVAVGVVEGRRRRSTPPSRDPGDAVPVATGAHEHLERRAVERHGRAAARRARGRRRGRARRRAAVPDAEEDLDDKPQEEARTGRVDPPAALERHLARR